MIIEGDCTVELAKLEPDSFDSCVTDPPYHLTSIVKRFGGENAAPAQFGTDGVYARSSTGFMGKTWDGGDVAFRPETWAAVLRVLKPGAFLLAFGGTRTYHRLAMAIEAGGFDVRDAVMWHYGQGFPKSLDITKTINKSVSGVVVHKWAGFGTALKPATEIICLARKPFTERTVVANVLEWGTGALNIDGCRIDGPEAGLSTQTQRQQSNRKTWEGGTASGFKADHVQPTYSPLGRWPANIIHDGSAEVLEAFPDSKGGGSVHRRSSPKTSGIYGAYRGDDDRWMGHGDAGSAARFFYCAKAAGTDRAGSEHPTIKPVSLLRWCVRLVTPPGGHVLDPFAGSGTTGAAALAEGLSATLIEAEPEYVADIRSRLGYGGLSVAVWANIKARRALGRALAVAAA